jgi:hypothetical protein
LSFKRPQPYHRERQNSIENDTVVIVEPASRQP